MSSEFFSNYPRIAYDISGSNSIVPDYTVAVNLMIRNKLKKTVEDDVTIYYPYIVPEGMRPDVLEREIIYSYGYEQDLNESKREIQLIDSAYIQTVQDEARGLFR